MFQTKTINHGRPRLIVRTAILCALVLQAASAGDMVKRVIEKAMPSVVVIHILDEKGDTVASGSGYVVGRSRVATNYHVVKNAKSAVVVLSDEQKFRVRGGYVDEKRDLAILEVEATSLPVADLGDSDRLKAGDDVIAIGAPLGVRVLFNTVTSGIVSGIRDFNGTKWIQHTAPISHGNSGGALLNSRGQVVGMNTMYLSEGQSLYFAVPVNYIKAALAHLPAQMPSLRDLAAEQQARDQARSASETEKRFYRYEDPDGLFRVVLPKAWQTQRTVKRDEGGNQIVSFMAFDPTAGKADLNSLVAAGIRIRIVIPAEGQAWNEDTQLAVMKAVLGAAASGYREGKATEPKDIEVAGRSGIEMFIVGTPKQGSTQQLASVIVLPGSKLFAVVEISVPADHEDVFKAVHEVFVKSFQLATT